MNPWWQISTVRCAALERRDVIGRSLYVYMHCTAGPFVMNTEAEVRQAEDDYARGTNGFEGAHQWNSFVVTDDTY